MIKFHFKSAQVRHVMSGTRNDFLAVDDKFSQIKLMRDWYKCVIHCVPKSGPPTDGDNFVKTKLIFKTLSALERGGLTDLIFVDPGVKINCSYYRDVLLSQQLLPVMCDLSAISSPCNKTAHLHTGHATRCNFLSSQHPLSFLQICGRRIAST